MFLRIWQFRARHDRVGEFRDTYGSDGAWARLFARGAGFLGTELLQAAQDPFLYVTIDRWESADAWAAFLRACGTEYAALDRRCESLTEDELELGTYVQR